MSVPYTTCYLLPLLYLPTLPPSKDERGWETFWALYSWFVCVSCKGIQWPGAMLSSRQILAFHRYLHRHLFSPFPLLLHRFDILQLGGFTILAGLYARTTYAFLSLRKSCSPSPTFCDAARFILTPTRTVASYIRCATNIACCCLFSYVCTARYSLSGQTRQAVDAVPAPLQHCCGTGPASILARSVHWHSASNL